MSKSQLAKVKLVQKDSLLAQKAQLTTSAQESVTTSATLLGLQHSEMPNSHFDVNTERTKKEHFVPTILVSQ